MASDCQLSFSCLLWQLVRFNCLLCLVFISNTKLCFSQIITPAPFGCAVPGFDYFNLTALVWSLELNQSTCLLPKNSAQSQAESPCSLLLAFCHDLSNMGPCELSSVCQRSPKANLSLGMYTQNPFLTHVPSSLHGLQAKFVNGDPYTSASETPCQLKTLVTLTCNRRAKWLIKSTRQTIQEAPQPLFINFNANTCEMNIGFDYAGACQYTPKEQNIGPGTIVILVFSVSFLLYLAIGSMINIGQGRAGAEIIPHHDFWFSLPSYIKDGCKFTFCQICSNQSKNGGYSAI